ncbi:MAG: hypothetical protein A2283_13275 [Lentisphaerae bacterium RIFOXYA12_FULL_48_11]|nr:MAG: hypothetical protein A2283_13275 [Lentisphaerae bacterium RIFOXYA12_FULL_48_11]
MNITQLCCLFTRLRQNAACLGTRDEWRGKYGIEWMKTSQGYGGVPLIPLLLAGYPAALASLGQACRGELHWYFCVMSRWLRNVVFSRV